MLVPFVKWPFSVQQECVGRSGGEGAASLGLGL